MRWALLGLSALFSTATGLQQHQFTEDEPVVSQTAIVVWAYSNSNSRRSVGNSESVKRTRTQTRVKEEQLLSSVNEEEREESFEDSENSGAIVEEPVVSETTNRPMVTLLCQIPEGSNHNASAATVGIIKSHASQILGFKFQYYQRLEVNDPVPSELYQLTALLVKRDFIDVDSIYAHLLPKEDAAFDHYNAFLAKRLDEANKIGRIIVAATGKDLMDEEKQGDVTVDLYAAFDGNRGMCMFWPSVHLYFALTDFMYGWGVAVLIGIPHKEAVFKTHPMNFLNERTVKGTFFGNYKPRSNIPSVVEKYMNKEFELEKFITHTLPIF
ncbi:hypothetical protein KY285_007844 [Solanum tuberosum]|nr:hypothetical protein KY285_007844 [Solanum tuberosum]